MIELTLLPTRNANRLFAGEVPASLNGGWCALRLPMGGGRDARAVLVLDMGEDMTITAALAPGAGGVARSLIFMPQDARELRVELLGTEHSPERLQLSFRRLGRFGAARRLFARAPLPTLRAALGGRAGRQRRVRAALARASGAPPPVSYRLWTALFDHWPEEEEARLAAFGRADILALVLCAGVPDSPAALASLDSLAKQAVPVRVLALPHGAPVAAALDGASEPYVAILQAGEVLPPHASALLGAWMARHGTADALCADEDALDKSGIRAAPLFKPEPNRALMLSGTLTRGLWLFRRDWLVANAPETASWAEALRLELWLRLHEAGWPATSRRVPFVLAHRRHDAEDAPRAAVEAVVRDHFARLEAPVRIAAGAGALRVSPLLPAAAERSVALMIPSTLRPAHVRRCLRAVLEKTGHRAFEVLVVVSQTAPLDAEQRATLAAIGEHPRLRVLALPVERFNFSTANNFANSRSGAEFVCLLNDDVAPLAPDWLDLMLGHFADPGVGAVGAKLLYENGTVQHGGIIVGLAGLAEHANRGLRREAPGYASRATLDQELSASTGACLLVRRSAYDAVGGMDEGFPIAFNDVDFCLKLREAGHRIVFCAQAELVHYESLSLGHHFSGERAAMEREEVRRMRQRWAKVVAEDPFHNPNLSLTRGQEWSLAFPPRARKLLLPEG